MMTTRRTNGRATSRQIAASLLVAAAAVLGLGSPAGAEPQGYVQIPYGVGFFYGTFDQSPNNLQLLVGGTAADFCATAADAGIHPFEAEPGVAPGRMYPRNDGALDFKVNDKNQSIHLYDSGELADGPAWIEGVCDGSIEADLFASGTADLKVRVSVGADGVVDVFNSVNGKATGSDGAYKVRAWADLVVVAGVPQGNPADFVGLELHEIRR